MIDHRACGVQSLAGTCCAAVAFVAGALDVWQNARPSVIDTTESDMSEFDATQDMASGMAAFEAKEFAQAWRLLKPLAERGDPQAQHRLAIMCQNGLGMARNDLMAYKWMRAAAESGYALAQHGLGFMYLYGECTEKNEKEAVNWFERAAAQGLVGSAMTLGMMYEQGQGVEKDEATARRWYARAERKS
jgi:hypothetical protein